MKDRLKPKASRKTRPSATGTNPDVRDQRPRLGPWKLIPEASEIQYGALTAGILATDVRKTSRSISTLRFIQEPTARKSCSISSKSSIYVRYMVARKLRGYMRTKASPSSCLIPLSTNQYTFAFRSSKIHSLTPTKSIPYIKFFRLINGNSLVRTANQPRQSTHDLCGNLQRYQIHYFFPPLRPYSLQKKKFPLFCWKCRSVCRWKASRRMVPNCQ